MPGMVKNAAKVSRISYQLSVISYQGALRSAKLVSNFLMLNYYQIGLIS